MAVINWKQISENLGAYGNLTGSLNISGSIYLNGESITGLDAADLSHYATTGSNQFKGTQYISGSLIPEALDTKNGIYDLGSLSAPWRDLYITTSSLKFVKDGTLVSSVNGEPNAIRIGNILITTSSVSVVEGAGDTLSIVQTVFQANYSSSGEVIGAVPTALPSGLISSSAQILDLGFISGVTAGAGLSGGGSSGDLSLSLDTGSAHFLNALAKINNAGIFKQTGSFWSTSNNLQITGSLTIGDGLLKLKEYTSIPTPEAGAIYYSASNFYFGID